MKDKSDLGYRLMKLIKRRLSESRGMGEQEVVWV